MSASSSWHEWRDRATPFDTGGTTVATYDLGDPGGRPVTFLHGYPSSSLDVDPVLAHLGVGWRVLAVDLPGFGASAKPRERTYSIHAAVDAVEAWWAHLGLGATVLAAHDYSVSVAQELLARRLDESAVTTIDAVVFMNGGVYPNLHRPTRGQQALLDPEHGAAIAGGIDQVGFVAGIEGTWGQRVPFDVHAAREMYRSMHQDGGVAMMHTLLHYVADRREHADRWSHAMENTDVPLSFVWGDLDPVSGAHMIERVEQRCPDARVVRLADAAHWPPLEAPDVVAAEIDRLS